MVQFLIVLLEIWKRRGQIVLPALLFPLALITLTLAQPPKFTAFTTLHLAAEKIGFPPLRELDNPQNLDILRRVIASDSVVRNALLEAAVINPTSPAQTITQAVQHTQHNLFVNAEAGQLLQLYLQSENPERLTQILEALANNFIFEILAPERLRIEQQLAQVGNKIKFYAEQIQTLGDDLNKVQELPLGEDSASARDARLKRIIGMEFNIQRARAQKTIAEEEYNDLLHQANALTQQYNISKNESMVWYVEPPVMAPITPLNQQILNAVLLGLFMAFIFSTLLILYRYITDNSLRSDEEIKHALHHKILGRIPDLGNVQVEDGRLSVNVRTSF